MLYGRFPHIVQGAVVAERLGPVEPHRVGLQHADGRPVPRHLLERGHEGPVELDGEHVGAGVGDRDGERAEPGPDLHHSVARRHTGVGDDRAREVRIDQEVLAERLRGADAVAGGEVADRAGAEPAGRGAAGTGAGSPGDRDVEDPGPERLEDRERLR